MKKTVSKLLALALTAVLVLTGCGGTNSGSGNEGGDASGEASANEITDPVLGIISSRELETFNWLYSQRAEDGENLTNR